ncbi:MAG TPA: hypothetical protein VHK91_04995 [Flavisolibacter sp.]|jgi:hypothetical protein|nr:hypothetical protein [Flavisolibacter sp.]
MKKSNKLLLGGFLAVLLLTISIHVTLYAKYKRGDYTIYHEEDELPRNSLQSFPHIRAVSIQNVADAIIQFSDVAQVKKDEDNGLQYQQTGDSLTITGPPPGEHHDIRYNILLMLPYNAKISVNNSSLRFKKNTKAADSSLELMLRKSAIMFNEGFRVERMTILASDSSAALFRGITKLGSLNVGLSNSSFEYVGGELGQLAIVTDSLSRISLPSKQLLKAKISTTQ